MWFEMTPQTLAWAEAIPTKLSNTAILDAPPEEVFAVLADIDEWPRWFADIRKGVWDTEPPHGVGSRRTVTLNTMKVREAFLAWEVGRRYSFAIVASTLPLARSIVEDYRLTPAGDGKTRLDWDVSYEVRGYVRPVQSILRRVFRNMFRKATRGFVEHIENMA